MVDELESGDCGTPYFTKLVSYVHSIWIFRQHTVTRAGAVTAHFWPSSAPKGASISMHDTLHERSSQRRKAC